MAIDEERVLVSGTVFLFAIATLGVHVYHLINEDSLTQIVTGVAPPAIVSLGLVGVSLYVYRGTVPDAHLERFLGWVFGVAIALAALGSALMVYQMSHGSEIFDGVFVVVSWSATGGLGGSLIGYYDGKLQRTAAELERERDAIADRQRALEHQNQRLEELAHIVSHDLRNPLNVARGRIELSMESGDTSTLDSAVNALDRMNMIIEDTLEMARGGQTVADEELEPVALRDIAESSWRSVQTGEATLEMDCDCRFLADRSRLQSVFENLFRNAIEHGRSDVTVTVGALEDPAGFYVEDDGPGLPSTEEVFDPGYTTAESGTGLGLAIVTDIVATLGWDIEATTAKTGGARFEITGVELS